MKHGIFETKTELSLIFILNGNSVSFLCDYEQFLVPESIFQFARNSNSVQTDESNEIFVQRKRTR